MSNPFRRGGASFCCFRTREKAGSYTETVIQAFEALPDGEKKKETLRQAYALLRLSNELVARAGLERRVIGESVAQGRIDLPSDFALHKIAGRATFSERDIAAMGVEMNDLAPFIQSAADDTALLDVLPGNSQLEFQPMLQTERGLVVALPANLSIAVRALLIDTAAKHKLGRMLQYNLLRAQRTLMNLGNFRARRRMGPCGG